MLFFGYRKLRFLQNLPTYNALRANAFKNVKSSSGIRPKDSRIIF